MALKFQYNKTFLQQLRKELAVRLNALPTLQAKESALRVEVKKAHNLVEDVRKRLEEMERNLQRTNRLWVEFPDGLVRIKDVRIGIKKIAGVKTPVFEGVSVEVTPFSLFSEPSWVPDGVELLKQAASLRIERDVALKKVEILEYARKKTTQKVNLYEKVQIPAYEEGIRKIKRYLEDKDNLAKSSQKILKGRLTGAAA